MDSIALSAMPLLLLFQIIEKMSNWDLCHLRVASSRVDALVKKYEKYFKSRHEMGMVVNFVVDSEDPKILKLEVYHDADKRITRQSEESFWTTEPFQILDHIVIKRINIDISKDAEEGMTKKIIDVLKTMTLSCGSINFWGTTSAEEIVEITNLIKCQGDITVNDVRTGNTRAFVEGLAKSSKKSQISLFLENRSDFGRSPLFCHIKDFRKSFDMGTVSPQQFHQFLMDMFLSQDSCNLSQIYFETCVMQGEPGFFQDGLPVPPLEVIWDKTTLPAEKNIPSWIPKTIRKIDLPTKWAVVVEDSDVNTEMTTISNVTIHLIEKNPVELLDLLKQKGIVGELDEEEFYEAKYKRRAEILKDSLVFV